VLRTSFCQPELQIDIDEFSLRSNELLSSFFFAMELILMSFCATSIVTLKQHLTSLVFRSISTPNKHT
jgi:hypothetical protein